MMTIDKNDDKENVDSTNIMLQRWLKSQQKADIRSVKLSDAKDQFPTITLIALERLFEALIADGILIVEGSSRVKNFKIINEKIKVSDAASSAIIPKKKEANHSIKVSNDQNPPKKTFITANSAIAVSQGSQRRTSQVREVQKPKHQLPSRQDGNNNKNNSYLTSSIPVMVSTDPHVATCASPLPQPLQLPFQPATAVVCPAFDLPSDEALALVRQLLRNAFLCNSGAAFVGKVNEEAVSTSGGSVTAEAAQQALEYLAHLNKIMIFGDEIVEI